MEPFSSLAPGFPIRSSLGICLVPTFTPAIESPSFCRLCIQNAWPNLSSWEIYPRLLENKECCSPLHRHTHRPPSFLPSVSFRPQNSPVPFSNFLLPSLPSARLSWLSLALSDSLSFFGCMFSFLQDSCVVSLYMMTSFQCAVSYLFLSLWNIH